MKLDLFVTPAPLQVVSSHRCSGISGCHERTAFLFQLRLLADLFTDLKEFGGGIIDAPLPVMAVMNQMK